MRFLALVLVSACAPYTPDTFHEESTQLGCELAVRCGAWADEATCVASAQVDDTRGCTFDASAAKTCADDLASARCPQDGSLPDPPESCDAVWSACP